MKSASKTFSTAGQIDSSSACVRIPSGSSIYYSFTFTDFIGAVVIESSVDGGISWKEEASIVASCSGSILIKTTDGSASLLRARMTEFDDENTGSAVCVLYDNESFVNRESVKIQTALVGTTTGWDVRSALNTSQMAHLPVSQRGFDEVQSATPSEVPAKGAMKFKFDSVETASIAFDATASAITAALEAHASIGAGNVVATGTFATAVTVTFGGTLAKTNVGALSCDTNTLAKEDDTAVTLTFATETAGISETPKSLVVPIHGIPQGSKITGFMVEGTLSSSGELCELTASMRKVTPSASGVTDSLVASAETISVTENTILSPLSTFTRFNPSDTDGCSHYILIGGRTGAASAIDLTSVVVEYEN